RTVQDTGTRQKRLLVARNVHIHQEICGWLHYLSANENKYPSDDPTVDADEIHSNETVHTNNFGFHYRFTIIGRVRLNYGHGRPWSFEGGNFNPMHKRNYRAGNGRCLP